MEHKYVIVSVDKPNELALNFVFDTLAQAELYMIESTLSKEYFRIKSLLLNP